MPPVGGFPFYCPFITKQMSYTPEVPNQISHKDLQDLMQSASANHPNDATNQVTINGKTQEEIEQICSRLCTEANDAIQHPIAHKVMMLMMLSNLIAWHTSNGVGLIKDGDEESGIAWLRDAGKLQSAASDISDIYLGPDDFTSPQPEVDDNN